MALVDEAEVSKHRDSLFVVGQQLEILVRHELSKLHNVLLDDPFVVLHCKLIR